MFGLHERIGEDVHDSSGGALLCGVLRGKQDPPDTAAVPEESK
jgi:hypothetical protein